MKKIEFKEVEKFSEEMCDICCEQDWGDFMILPNGDKVCPDCLDKIKKAILVREYEKTL